MHFQLIDHRSVLLADGIPFAFTTVMVDGEPTDGVPTGAEPFTADG